jgi:hypothetical protein
LRDVKNKFADRKDVYDTFLEIMKEFKSQRCVHGAGDWTAHQMGLAGLGGAEVEQRGPTAA